MSRPCEKHRSAFCRVFVDQRILNGKTVQSLQTQVFGNQSRAPIMVAR
ncbi:hypothetical protein I5S53_02045 [Pseudomonas juntendi]|nr:MULTISPECIES: hypothetical protein [Pseudomonas]MBH3382761.1 hypothetical protein [Pseudomonas juntendi]